MRGLTSIILLTTATAAWAGEPTMNRRLLDVDRESLTAAEVERYAAPYRRAIKGCYLEHGQPAKTATGELALRLNVHRDGDVLDVAIDAPGVTGKRLRGLARCVRAQVATWHFPVRRNPTSVILPYYFLELALPGTGPQPSCWNRRGCRHVRR
jgi:hypothetical protein